MVTVAQDCLNSCAGCEIALLNMGEELLELLPQLEFVHMPVLMDNKYFGPLGCAKKLHIPHARIGLVSGGVRNSEHLEVLHTMRQQVDILVAMGTCAATGGLPGLAGDANIAHFAHYEAPSLQLGNNLAPLTLNPCSQSADSGNIPQILPRCTSLAQHVRVDLIVPGCPPHPDWIAESLRALLEDRPALLPSRSVCSLCPAKRSAVPSISLADKNTGESAPKLCPPRRMLEQPVFDPQQPLSAMQCLLEQGFLCLGPVTLAGCGGREGAPKCIAARTPCRGCQGPVASTSLPFVDYMAALTAAGFDAASMPDKPGYLSRFNSAHTILTAMQKGTSQCATPKPLAQETHPCPA